ncbi:hypothetical protein [Kerstersia sp.]|uniref:hypothetical protein n=1 Tax=Kerstersia sp. TaxID=1930783 RepID=UPI003F8DE626
MSVLARFIVAGVLAVIVILLAIVLGDYGPWYFSWLLGTGFMILVAALGGVLFEAQEEAAERGDSGKAKVSRDSSGY